MTDISLEGLSDKQLRLFAVRCARRVQHLMRDPRSIAALDVAERHANGQATDEELAEAADAAWDARDAAADAARDAARVSMAARAARDAASVSMAVGDAEFIASRTAELDEQQKILDEIRQEQPR